MSAILHGLTRFGKTTLLPALPSLIGFGLLTPCVAVATDPDRELLQDLREALRLSGLSDKEVAHYLHINKGLCSKKLGGERPLSFAALSLLPVDVRRWLAVRWVMRFGVPVEITTGARLQRRALRMSLSSSHKEGVA